MWGYRGFGERHRCLLLAGLVLLGCGGKTIDAGSAITLENACQRLPQEYCARDAPCCQKAGFSFDHAECEKQYRTGCMQQVRAVSAGKMTFHPEKIQECLRAVQPSYDVCILDPAGFERFAKQEEVCYGVFAGVTKVGEPCQDLFECVHSGTYGTYCDQVNGVCAEVPPPGTIGDTCDAWCAPWLTCDLSTNTCVAKPPSPIVKFGCSGTQPPSIGTSSDGGF